MPNPIGDLQSRKLLFVLAAAGMIFAAANPRAQEKSSIGDWKTYREYIEFVLKNNPDVIIDTIRGKTFDDFTGKSLGQYHYKDKKCRISYFVTDAAPTDEIFSELDKENQAYNSLIPIVCEHELHHRDVDTISLAGLNAYEIIQLAIYDEISARVSELLAHHHIYSVTGSIAAAFAGLIPDGKSEHDFDSYLNGSGSYAKYLAKHKLSGELSQKDIDVIITSAISKFLLVSGEYTKQVKSTSNMRIKKTCHGNMHSFDDVISICFTFGERKFLEECSPNVSKKLKNAVNKVMSGAELSAWAAAFKTTKER